MSKNEQGVSLTNRAERVQLTNWAEGVSLTNEQKSAQTNQHDLQLGGL